MDLFQKKSAQNVNGHLMQRFFLGGDQIQIAVIFFDSVKSYVGQG